ncbi:unnamed protein product (macronuclear) [Paramecium tetraurelia]|uniref:Uncharacterized protein n=1 Tax=Paramecium tetraurelia TaxID=5888 RepID=A0C9B3_PARTE|nr:uncharacterized protein GSPATT00006686001 [Paramecium tetraurelia]CAK67380.1 unnamed protein product [Paramecium tetraurelia]|eukprot:XP_001434777.1 hypothetical protein (macronuclear) [Paramecium tetraurelia strain d4-2]
MEIESHRHQKQSTFQCSKDRLKQINKVSQQEASNTLYKKSCLFAFKDQKIKFRFPLADEHNLDNNSTQQEIIEQSSQIKVTGKHNLKTQDFATKSIEIEEENKENINEILIEPPSYQVSKITIPTQTGFFKQFTQQIYGKLYEQQF